MTKAMRITLRIIGVAAAALGTLALFPVILLLNQRLHLVHLEWGIFDIRVNNVMLSNTIAGAISVLVGITLLGVGVVLFRWPRRTAP